MWKVVFLLVSSLIQHGAIFTGNDSLIAWTDKFAGIVSSDQIIYTTVKIPSHAVKVDLTVWATPSSLNPIVLFRYDGIPTPTIYDAKYSLPSVPLKVRLVDDEPTASQLYIGIWGGELLHSYRYFAGSPVFTTVGVTTVIESCPSNIFIAPTCRDLAPLAPLHLKSLTTTTDQSNISLLVAFNTTSTFTMIVPENVQTYRMMFNYYPDNTEKCQESGMNTRVFYMIAEMYLDQPLEDENYLRQIFVVDAESICSRQSGNPNWEILEMRYPLPGQWIARISFKSMKEESFTELRVSVKTDMTPLNATYISFPNNNKALLQHIETPLVVAILATDRTSSGDSSIYYRSQYLTFPMNDIFTSSFNDSSMNHRLIYAAPLDSHKDQLIIGGGVEIQLHLRFKIAKSSFTTNKADIEEQLENWLQKILSNPLQLIGRVGNIPQSIEEEVSTSYTTSGSNSPFTNISIYSENAFIIHSDDSKKSWYITTSRDSLSYELQCQYVWTIMKPRLPQLEDASSRFLYITVLSFNDGIFDDAIRFQVSSDIALEMTFTACPVNACVHGVCTIQDGDIPTSQCICR